MKNTIRTIAVIAFPIALAGMVLSYIYLQRKQSI